MEDLIRRVEAERQQEAREQLERQKRGLPNGACGTNRISRYAPGSYRPQQIDVHELLKKGMFSSNSAECDSHFEKGRPCPAEPYGVSDQFVELDSFEKVESSNIANGEFIFNFLVQGVTKNQAIGVTDTVENVIGMQVTDFTIPLLPSDQFNADTIMELNPGWEELGLVQNGALPTTGNSVSNPQTQVPFGSRITMFIPEIGQQSFSDYNGRRHQFEFDASPSGPADPPNSDGDRILLTPLRHSHLFLFTQPVYDINGLTLRFYNPDYPIKFPPDCLYGTTASTDANSRVQFTYADPTNLINLAVGDRIYIDGFNVQGQTTLNNYMSRNTGHIVGQDGFNVTQPSSPGESTTVTFRLNPDVFTNGLSTPIPPNTQINSRTSITVRVAKNRIRIPMRFRKIVDHMTNYIAP